MKIKTVFIFCFMTLYEKHLKQMLPIFIRMILLFLFFLFIVFLVLSKGPNSFSLTEIFKNENQDILWNFRLPLVISAVFGGMGLSVAGLVMQSVFKNPLAGPFVLGVSSGASLGVALVGVAGIAITSLNILPAALIGGFCTVFIVFLCSRFFIGKAGILIVGLMIGYFADAIVSLVLFFGEANALRGFITWGMGSFSRLSIDNVPCFSLAILIGFLPICFSVRYLNLAPFGDDFVKDHGLSVKFFRWLTLLSASFLASVVTAFCGPIAFLGLAVPHLAYGIFKTTNHAVLLPTSALLGATLALLASLFSYLPLQAIMSVIGVPVILWVLLSSRGKNRE